MKDLDLLELTDKEKIEFLLAQRTAIINWIKKEEKKHEDDRKPLPHPLDFSMRTDEERDTKESEIWAHNWHCDAVVGAYSYLLTAIEVGDAQMINQRLREKFPGNDYSI